MSVTSSNIGPWVINGGSGITTVSYTQNVLNASDIGAYLTDGNGYQYPPLTNGVDFTVNGVNSYNSAAWTITYPAGTSLLTGWKFNAVLQIPYTQPYSLSALGGYDPNVVETKIADRLSLQIQQLNATLAAAVYPSTSAAVAAALAAIGSANNTFAGNSTFTGTATFNNTVSGSGITTLLSPYLTSSTAASTYLTQSNASSTYAPISSISGTAGQVAVFTGTNATASYSQLSYTNSASSPGLTLYGTLYPTYTVANSTGSVSAEFSANSVFALVGSYSNHPFCIRTNNTNRFNFLANGNAYYSTQTLTAGSTVTWDASTGNDFILTPNQTCTINVTNPQAGAWYILTLTASSSSYTITFGTNIKSTGTLATGTVAGKQFVLLYRSDGTNLIEMSRTAAL